MEVLIAVGTPIFEVLDLWPGVVSCQRLLRYLLGL